MADRPKWTMAEQEAAIAEAEAIGVFNMTSIFYRGKEVATGAKLQYVLEDYADARTNESTGKPFNMRELQKIHDVSCNIYTLALMYPELQKAIEQAASARADSLHDMSLDVLFDERTLEQYRDDRGNISSSVVTLMKNRSEALYRHAAAGNAKKFGTRQTPGSPTALLHYNPTAL